MKHLIFILLCSLSINLTAQTSENLYHYCKIWGLLKYYTPEAGRGKVNVDELFLTTWPQFKQCKNQKKFDAFLQYTILAKFPSMNKVASQMDIQVFKNFIDTNEYRVLVDFNWVKDDYLSTDVQAKLVGGLNTYKGVKKKWMKTSWGYTRHKETNLELTNSSDTLQFYYLTLFKYWNWVEYFFAYKNLMDTNWDNDLRIAIDEIQSTDKRKFAHMLHKLKAKNNDVHAQMASLKFYNPPSYWLLFPFLIKWDKGMARVATTNYVSYSIFQYANDRPTKLCIGDTILEINNLPIKEWNSITTSLISFSKITAAIKNSDEVVKYTSSYPIYSYADTLVVKVQRENKFIVDTLIGKPVMDSLVITKFDRLQVNTSSVPDSLRAFFAKKQVIDSHPDIAYLSFWNCRTAKDLKAFFKKEGHKSYLIIDQYRGMSDYLAPFFSKKPKEIARAYPPLPTYPGVYKHSFFPVMVYNTSKADWFFKAFFPKTKKLIPRKLKQTYEGTVILLVGTGYSAMETQIMMLQAYCENLIIVGCETPGTNGNVTDIYLPFGIQAQTTGTIFEYPDGRQFQRIGVTPDYIIETPFEVEYLGFKAKYEYMQYKTFEFTKKLAEGKKQDKIKKTYDTP